MTRRKPVDIPDLRTEPVPWNPGEHIAIIGTTGTGKSYLMSRVVDLRKYVAIFRTKPDDIKFKGYVTAPSHKALSKMRVTDEHGRFLIVPPYTQQMREGAYLFDHVWRSGGWTLVIDELFYVQQKLGLGPFVDMLLTQGRSKRISIVSGMQRPVHVTRFALSEMTHIFSFSLERRDRKVIADIANEDFAIVSGMLPRYHFAHYHVPTRTVAVGTADRLERVLTVAGRSDRLKGG